MLWRAKIALQRLRNSLQQPPNRKRSYPKAVAVYKANEITVSFLKSTTCTRIAEIGIYRGHTSLEIASFLNGRGSLSLFDFQDVVDEVHAKLMACGFTNIQSYGSSYRYLDSYNWSLMKLIEETPAPIFDYVFLDGAHTWAIDALTFFLVDKLLMPGGYVDFDDYNWTLRNSPTLRPEVFPLTAHLYTEEQIDTKQVALVVNLLVKRDPRYREIIQNKIYQKMS